MSSRGLASLVGVRGQDVQRNKETDGRRWDLVFMSLNFGHMVSKKTYPAVDNLSIPWVRTRNTRKSRAEIKGTRLEMTQGEKQDKARLIMSSVKSCCCPSEQRPKMRLMRYGTRSQDNKRCEWGGKKSGVQGLAKVILVC